MRRSASEVIRNLESRVARLENRTSGFKGFDVKFEVVDEKYNTTRGRGQTNIDASVYIDLRMSGKDKSIPYPQA